MAPFDLRHHHLRSQLGSLGAAWGTITALLSLLPGCQPTPSSGPAAGAAPPPPAVEVADAVAQKIVDYRVFTGRTAAVNSVEVRPRVSGYLLQTPTSETRKSAPDEPTVPTSLPDGAAFHPVIEPGPPPVMEDGTNDGSTRGSKLFIVRVHEGDHVEANEPLFEIDPEPYRLAYQQAVAQLKATQAQLVQFRRQLQRLQQLKASNAASASEYDQAVSSEAQAVAQVDNLQALAARAYLDWQYTQVRSPIAGLVGRSLITRGNLAVADTTVLTTVVTTDPIYVYFDVDENSALDYNARVQRGQVESARNTTIKVDMELANETGFPHQGVVDFVSNTTDPQTGNIQIRARFDNPTGILTPGLFARVRAPFTAPYQAVLVPTVALGADQQGRYVMVVDETEHVHRQQVEVGNRRGDLTVIQQGLEPGQRVITSGLQRARDGAPVSVTPPSQPVPPPTETTQPKTTQPKTTQPKTTQPKTTQPKAPQPKTPQPPPTDGGRSQAASGVEDAS